MRQINCSGCNANMGEIRDARLRKGIAFLCADCETRRIRALSYISRIGGANGRDVVGDIMEWIRGAR